MAHRRVLLHVTSLVNLLQSPSGHLAGPFGQLVLSFQWRAGWFHLELRAASRVTLPQLPGQRSRWQSQQRQSVWSRRQSFLERHAPGLPLTTPVNLRRQAGQTQPLLRGWLPPVWVPAVFPPQTLRGAWPGYLQDCSLQLHAANRVNLHRFQFHPDQRQFHPGLVEPRSPQWLPRHPRLRVTNLVNLLQQPSCQHRPQQAMELEIPAQPLVRIRQRLRAANRVNRLRLPFCLHPEKLKQAPRLQVSWVQGSGEALRQFLEASRVDLLLPLFCLGLLRGYRSGLPPLVLQQYLATNRADPLRSPSYLR